MAHIPHYNAAKHGLVGLMRSLANELAPHHIRVNTIHPTNVDTPMFQNPAPGRPSPGARTRPSSSTPRSRRG